MSSLITKQDHYYRVQRSIYTSYAFRSLSFKSCTLYHHMLTKFNGGNNGNISATLSIMKHFGWASSATLSCAIKELLEHGFIKKTRQSGMGAMKQCSLYAFTHLPIAENTRLRIKGELATHEYRNFEGSIKKKSLVRKLNRADSKYESVSPLIDSDFVGWHSETIQNMNTVKMPSKALKIRVAGISELNG